MSKDADKATKLFDAIRAGNLAETKKLLKRLPVDIISASRQTPLHVAAVEGKIEIMRFLIDKKSAQLNAKDRDGWTPLHCACKEGHLEVCDELMSRGAQVNCLTTNGYLPLHYFVRAASQTAHPHLHEKIFRNMTRKGVNVNQQNAHGETPLHLASFHGKVLSVDMLLSSGANPNLRNKYKETSLHSAARGGNLSICQKLLAAGADPNLAGDEGAPVDVARKCNHAEIVTFFELTFGPSAAPLMPPTTAPRRPGTNGGAEPNIPTITPDRQLPKPPLRTGGSMTNLTPTPAPVPTPAPAINPAIPFTGSFAGGAPAPNGQPPFTLAGSAPPFGSYALPPVPNAQVPFTLANPLPFGSFAPPPGSNPTNSFVMNPGNNFMPNPGNSFMMNPTGSFMGANIPGFAPGGFPFPGMQPSEAAPLPPPYGTGNNGGGSNQPFGAIPGFSNPYGTGPPSSSPFNPIHNQNSAQNHNVQGSFDQNNGYGNTQQSTGNYSSSYNQNQGQGGYNQDQNSQNYGNAYPPSGNYPSPYNQNQNQNQNQPQNQNQNQYVDQSQSSGNYSQVMNSGNYRQTSSPPGSFNQPQSPAPTPTPFPGQSAPSNYPMVVEAAHPPTESVNIVEFNPQQASLANAFPQTPAPLPGEKNAHPLPGQSVPSQPPIPAVSSSSAASSNSGSSSARGSSNRDHSQLSRPKPKAETRPAKPETRSPKPPADPKTIGHYNVGEKIGEGAFGKVYKALDSHTGALVAVKRITLAGVPPDEITAMMAELNLLKKLGDPNIVKFIEFIKEEEYLNFILEYVEGGSLQSIVKKFGNISEPLCARYIFQVLLGLDYLHRRGVIHRDIKCANILITKEGQVKLADFGIAAVPEGADSAENTLKTLKNGMNPYNGQGAKEAAGSPYWMAPEVIKMEGAVPQSDVWSMACTIIELITGNPPYIEMAPIPALFAMVQDAHPPFPANLSSELTDFLTRCFNKIPQERPTAKELLEHPWIINNVPDAVALRDQKLRDAAAAAQAQAQAIPQLQSQASQGFDLSGLPSLDFNMSTMVLDKAMLDLINMSNQTSSPNFAHMQGYTPPPGPSPAPVVVPGPPASKASELASRLVNMPTRLPDAQPVAVPDSDDEDEEEEEEDPVEEEFRRQFRQVKELLTWYQQAMDKKNGRQAIKFRFELKNKFRDVRHKYSDREEVDELRPEVRKAHRKCEEFFPDDIPLNDPTDSDDEEEDEEFLEEDDEDNRF